MKVNIDFQGMDIKDVQKVKDYLLTQVESLDKEWLIKVNNTPEIFIMEVLNTWINVHKRTIKEFKTGILSNTGIFLKITIN